MGFWTKREKTVFHRDQEGRVVDVEHKGDRELEYEKAMARRESREQQRQERRRRQSDFRKREREAYQRSFEEGRLSRARERGRQHGRGGLGGFTPAGGSPFYGNYNPFGSRFDMGLGYKRPTIKGNVRKKKKKLRKARTRGFGFEGLDIIDNTKMWKR